MPQKIVAGSCDAPSRDFATLRREILRRPNWTPRPLCKKDCGKVVDNKHIETAQRLPNDFKNNPFAIRHTQEELYRIPESLIREIFQSLSSNSGRVAKGNICIIVILILI